MIVFTIVGRFGTDIDIPICLSVAHGWLKLDITSITAQAMIMHQGKWSSWLIIRPIYWQRWAITSDITHSYL